MAQICDDKTILLVHIAQMTRASHSLFPRCSLGAPLIRSLFYPGFPPALKSYIEDPKQIKLGVQIAGDARKLSKDFGHKPAGLLELNNVARTVDPERFVARAKPGLVGLQELTGIYLDRYLSKETGVRCGKWGGELDQEQKYCESSRAMIRE